MRQIYQLAMVVFTACALVGCAGKMPLVGFDKKGEPVMAKVSESKYIEHLSEGMVSIQESVIPALENKSSGDTKWKLRTAVLGFGVKVEAGIGPFTVGLKPRVRAAFATGEKPPIP